MIKSRETNSRENKQFVRLLSEICKHTPHEHKHLRKFLQLVSGLNAHPLCTTHQNIREEQYKYGMFGVGLNPDIPSYWDYNKVKPLKAS